jgi:hypothetical protein
MDEKRNGIRSTASKMVSNSSRSESLSYIMRLAPDPLSEAGIHVFPEAYYVNMPSKELLQVLSHAGGTEEIGDARIEDYVYIAVFPCLISRK